MPFHRRCDAEDKENAGYLLDLLEGWAEPGRSDAGYNSNFYTLLPVAKSDLFRSFIKPLDPDEPPPTLADAEVALAFLVEEGWAELSEEGEVIRIPDRFHPRRRED